MNQKRNILVFPEQAVKASELYAIGLIHEIFQYLFQQYREQKNENIMEELIEDLQISIGEEELDQTINEFVTEFPPLAVHMQEMNLESFLKSEIDGRPAKHLVLEELILSWLTNQNNAYSQYLELFDYNKLKTKDQFIQIGENIQTFFMTQSPLLDQNLIAMFVTPLTIAPDSILDQLKFILNRWGSLLGKYRLQLLVALDFLKEETKLRGFGRGPTTVLDFVSLEEDIEKYSPDLDWMPNVVMLAKSTHVWMDQLTKKYQRQISRLDQIPDEELDQIAKWGYSALWLIGVWERSPSSKRIKHILGNIDAESSAYALYSYEIAQELGGYEAFQNLRDRAANRRIKLAGDMVPNHTGIYSEWIVNHPEWFIQLPHPPYPSYTFNGENLSQNPNIGVYIEDHYYDKTDAAVVFKRVDFNTGDTRYIYHGNDGTSMPWNDTAQINFLNPEAREAIIQTILHVARMFPIIRFDAAMTLTKKHHHRLWWPEPGSGGDIPSRSEHGLIKEEFNKRMPKEFWREVVDRVAKEVPNTLLLAEAFWLLEGYFVRSLGMHRVYNSAFMNMLKHEENSKYRLLIKNTLEFDPQILKRYVNFMSNPDEEPAVQFGKDDKYFGVAVLLVTMPGLPMFGHGQIEGFAEKYGMEYRRAYLDEQIDDKLVRRHEQELFPLMKKRYLFAEVDNFLLFDFYNSSGYVNEDVFAYSNQAGYEQALILYHNKYAEARGWITKSAAFSLKDGNTKKIIRKTLGEGFNFSGKEDHFIIFKDQITNMEYIRNSKDLYENGLYIELGAFKYHVFLEFREIQDNQWSHYKLLNKTLNGRGSPNVEEALREIVLQPILSALKELISPVMMNYLIKQVIESPTEVINQKVLTDIKENLNKLFNEIKKHTSSTKTTEMLIEKILEKLKTFLELKVLSMKLSISEEETKNALTYLNGFLENKNFAFPTMISWIFISNLGIIVTEEHAIEQSRSWIDEWLFRKIIEGTHRDMGYSATITYKSSLIIKILTSHQKWYEMKKGKPKRGFKIFKKLLSDPEIQEFIQVNRFKDTLWFNKEDFELLINYLLVMAVVSIIEESDSKQVEKDISEIFQIVKQWMQAKDVSEYKIETLLETLTFDTFLN
jgi:glycosidase